VQQQQQQQQRQQQQQQQQNVAQQFTAWLVLAHINLIKHSAVTKERLGCPTIPTLYCQVDIVMQ
jgi:hypothetical protein